MGALLILRSMNINISEQCSSPTFQATRTKFSPGWSYSRPLKVQAIILVEFPANLDRYFQQCSSLTILITGVNGGQRSIMMDKGGTGLKIAHWEVCVISVLSYWTGMARKPPDEISTVRDVWCRNQ